MASHLEKRFQDSGQNGSSRTAAPVWPGAGEARGALGTLGTPVPDTPRVLGDPQENVPHGYRRACAAGAGGFVPGV